MASFYGSGRSWLLDMPKNLLSTSNPGCLEIFRFPGCWKLFLCRRLELSSTDIKRSLKKRTGAKYPSVASLLTSHLSPQLVNVLKPLQSPKSAICDTCHFLSSYHTRIVTDLDHRRSSMYTSVLCHENYHFCISMWTKGCRSVLMTHYFQVSSQSEWSDPILATSSTDKYSQEPPESVHSQNARHWARQSDIRIFSKQLSLSLVDLCVL